MVEFLFFKVFRLGDFVFSKAGWGSFFLFFLLCKISFVYYIYNIKSNGLGFFLEVEYLFSK